MTVARTDKAWCKSLCHTLNTLRESSMFSDVIIRADNGRIFRAHTCILAASSCVLKAQLLRSQHYVDIPNITEHMWQVLLQFMYSGTVEIGDVVEIPSIVEIGKQLQLTELVSVCEDLFKGTTQKDTCTTTEEVFQGHTAQEEITDRPANSSLGVVNLKTENLDTVAHKTTNLHRSNMQIETPNTSTDGKDANSEIPRTAEFKCSTPDNEETGDSSHENDSADGTSQSTSDCVKADAVKEEVQQSSALSCNLCGKTFRRSASLRHHTSQHTGEKSHICYECGRCFSQRSSLNRHKQIHTGVKPHSCPVCNKAFFRVSHLVTHERQVHAVEKPHKCSDCNEAFSTRSELVAHGRVHIEEKLSSFPCTECDKTFTTLAHLTRHELAHSGDRPFTCGDCTKTFRHRSNLWRHRCMDHKHTPVGGKPFTCPICRRNFRLESSLARHEEIHSNVKRHLCVVCGKRFSKLLNLSAHARTHLDKRPYKCTMCDKAFKDGSNLRRHKLTHSDEKPFLCSACGKGFYRNVDMMEHFRRKHSAEKPFKCLLCGTGFSCRRDLNRHPCYKPADSRQNSDVAGRSMNEQDHIDQCTEVSSQSLTLDRVDMLDLVDVQTVDIDVSSDSLAQYTAQSTEQSTQPVDVNTVHILRFVV